MISITLITVIIFKSENYGFYWQSIPYHHDSAVYSLKIFHLKNVGPGPARNRPHYTRQYDSRQPASLLLLPTIHNVCLLPSVFAPDIPRMELCQIFNKGKHIDLFRGSTPHWLADTEIFLYLHFFISTDGTQKIRGIQYLFESLIREKLTVTLSCTCINIVIRNMIIIWMCSRGHCEGVVHDRMTGS